MQSARALLRSAEREYLRRRARSARIYLRQFAFEHLDGVPERLPLQRYDPREYPLRQAQRDGERDDRGGEKGALPRLHHGAAERLRHRRRRGRRYALRRREAAYLHRPRDLKKRAHYHP